MATKTLSEQIEEIDESTRTAPHVAMSALIDLFDADADDTILGFLKKNPPEDCPLCDCHLELTNQIMVVDQHCMYHLDQVKNRTGMEGLEW